MSGAPEETDDSSKVETIEDVLKFVIMFGVIAAALAASFTHMHDWTVRALMRAVEAPESSVSWYGWANATISELVPLAAFLSVRRRIASHMSAWSYPLVLALSGGVLSIFAQIAWVSRGVDGAVAAGFLAILPALASIAIVKLVMADFDVIRTRNAEAARKAEARRAEAERKADVTRKLEDAIRSARAEAEQARKAEAEAERKAAQAEGGRVQAEAEAASAQAAAEESAGRADRTRAEIDRARAQAERAQADARKATEEAGKLRAEADELARAREAHAAQTPRRRPARVLIDLPADLPFVEGVSPELVARVVNVIRDCGSATQSEIAEQAGTSDRTVRKVVQALTPLAEQEAR